MISHNGIRIRNLFKEVIIVKGRTHYRVKRSEIYSNKISLDRLDEMEYLIKEHCSKLYKIQMIFNTIANDI